ncbi:MAG: CDGSH-type Zn-finger protein [Enterobacterales bacterium]|jgi:CDGSH-type Zn-finger protein
MNNFPSVFDSPFTEEVEAGKTYHWCACGQSQKQPFCDGSHVGTQSLPMEYISDAKETIYFCGCKQSTYAPMCDGSHNKW